MTMPEIIQCPSCDGYGWLEDDGQVEDCDWCAGVGYVYRESDGLNRRIPATDFEAVSDPLEALEAQRLRGMGYSGEAKKPWEQAVRRKGRSGEEE